MHATNINFIGFHYTAADFLDHEIDAKIVERQLTHLIKTGTYLSDIVATIAA